MNASLSGRLQHGILVYDMLRSDVVFAWRQILKRKTTSAAAVLSLALAAGASTSAFRLLDALLFRPLPVSHPERLYALSREGNEGWEYRLFQPLRAAAKGHAELIALSFVNRADVAFQPSLEMEKAHLQYVSGWTFESFGLSPAVGRLFTAKDDRAPVAVLSYDYWSRRFGKDPKIVGRTLRLASNQGQASPGDVYEIIGIGPETFTGTEPGTVTDIFLPAAMNGYVNLPIAAFLRIFALLPPDADPEPVRASLRAAYQHQREIDKEYWSSRLQNLAMEPAPAGVSGMQKQYKLPLTALGVLAGLVLLIACANVANLMTAQAAARAREMAIRVAIGAGRRHLVQLVLVEGGMLALLATAIGAIFSWWAAPFVVDRINPPDNPAQLHLQADWRMLAFTLTLTLGVTILFGLAPALKASSIQAHSRRRFMNVLITAQVVFCFLVLFVGGLFVVTFGKLANQPNGFSPERLLILDAVAEQHPPTIAWEQLAEHLRTVPGVERVALAEWALMDGWGHKGSSVSINGNPPDPAIGSWFLSVSPEWLDTMRIPLLNGRTFRPSDVYLTPAKTGVAIVNQSFARQYFPGQDAIGKSFEATTGGLHGARMEIVGVVGDARYLNMREPIAPVVYSPFRWTDGAEWARLQGRNTFIIRTSSPNPLLLASTLRREISRQRSDFYVSQVRSQTQLIEMHTVRERLLAMLALFFAAVAVLLAGLGLYGVLDYSVVQRTREIGIRMALGARASNIASRVVLEVLVMVTTGAIAGLAIGMASARYIESILFQVKATDPQVLAIPPLAILAASLLAALPPLLRAIRIDPAIVLRSE